MLSVARLGLVILVAASLQAGCGGDDGADASSLEGTEWTLVDGVDAPDDSVPTLTLEDGTASGFGGAATPSPAATSSTATPSPSARSPRR